MASQVVVLLLSLILVPLTLGPTFSDVLRSSQGASPGQILGRPPPEILTLTANSQEEFVQMQVSPTGPARCRPPRVRQAEDVAPVLDGFVRDRDAAVREEVFDVAETQSEAVVEPDGVADDGAGSR